MKKITILIVLILTIIFSTTSLYGQHGFTVPALKVNDFGYNGGYRVEKHPRILADINGDNMADIIGFGDKGVNVSYSTGTGFTPHTRKVNNFGYDNGWRVEKHPRFMADVNGDNLADIVGFKNAGVYVSYSTGTDFTAPVLELNSFGYDSEWRVDKHLRIMADVNGDSRADIVGFKNTGVYVSYSTGTGFSSPQFEINYYGYNSGYRIDTHPRFLADFNGDNRANIVGFSYAGGHVAYSKGTYFTVPVLNLGDNIYDGDGWRPRNQPRFMADVNRDNRADVIEFARDGVYLNYSKGASFSTRSIRVNNFGYDNGWRVDKHPRFLADVNGDNMADIIGFGDKGVIVSYSVEPNVEIINAVTFEGAATEDTKTNTIQQTSNPTEAARIDNQKPTEIENKEDKLVVFSVPFNNQATIKYILKEDGPLNLSLYNMAGAKIAEILNIPWQQAGVHTFTFDASHVSRGVYLIRMRANSSEVLKKVVSGN